MEIAIHNPEFLLKDKKLNFNGYNIEFSEIYVKYIYMTDFRMLSDILKINKSKYNNKFKIIYSLRELNMYVDVLINFNGNPSNYSQRIPRKFKGIKVVHIMDFAYNSKKHNVILTKEKVDYLFGYNDHGKYSDFFKFYYPNYMDKVISIPFGYSERFLSQNNFNNRKNKAIALGSVNPIDDPLCEKNILNEITHFYSEEKFLHKFRRLIVENREKWNYIIDDLLPEYPITKNLTYDPVVEFNNYKMFINDEGLLNFPPARTYEGIACGCVMVATDNDIYKDLGFIDGYNSILFKAGNFIEMENKINFYINHPNLLEELHKNSLNLAKQYSHKLVANQVLEKLEEILNEYS